MSQIVDSVCTAIDLMPGAILVVDRHGELQEFNSAAAKMLHLDDASATSLFDVIRSTNRMKKVLQAARRSSGTLPFSFKLLHGEQRLYGHVRPIIEQDASTPEHLLVTLQKEDGAGHKMRMLTERLEIARHKHKLLRKQNRKLRKAVSKTLPMLREEVITDALTGIYNRRYFDEKLVEEWHRATRLDCEFSVVYIDVDHFKDYNDALGHTQGDSCLREIATILRNSLKREFDAVCRTGGEEFIMLLPMTGQDGAQRVARRALRALQRARIPHPASATADIVTASLGVGTCIPSENQCPADFVAAVDKAMYTAKQHGRNQICCIDPVLVQPGVAANSSFHLLRVGEN